MMINPKCKNIQSPLCLFYKVQVCFVALVFLVSSICVCINGNKWNEKCTVTSPFRDFPILILHLSNK